MFDYNKNIGMINSRLAQSVHDAQVVGGSLHWAPVQRPMKLAHCLCHGKIHTNDRVLLRLCFPEIV